jgi:tetratricopeptide (TPR) repeat protein
VRIASTALLCVVLTAVTFSRAAGDDAQDQAAFAEATRKLGAGDLPGARAALEALAAGSPGGRWADDALSEAAAIAERQGDRAGARALWRRLLAEYPESRLTRRAAARLAELTSAGGDGGRWDAVAAEHDRLVLAAAVEDPTPMLEDLGALLEKSVGYPRWFAAALWLGDAWARIGRRDLAHRWYERAAVVATTPLELFRADLARAELWAASGDHDRAERALRKLHPPDELARLAVADALDAVAKARSRARMALAARLALGVCALIAIAAIRRRAGSWRAAVRAFWPPPIEVRFVLPVALVLAFVSQSGNQLAARAAEMILAGGVAISWLSGTGLDLARRRGGPTPAQIGLHVAVVTVAVLALVYAAVMREQLLDLLAETWHHGHDMK